MIVSREREDLKPPPTGSVVSIGVFDGVHLGHEAILARNVACARALGAVPTVVTFRHHPKELILGRGPRTLTSLEHRLTLFARAGIGHAVALAFDESLRSLPATEFVDEVCVRGLAVRRFVLGFDSKFGHDRSGTPATLRSAGFPVEVVDEVLVDGRAVSSTAIREAIDLGDLAGAERMLGRPVSVLGTVVEGDHLGRRIGFPTANLDLDHELHPPPGVYACRARVVDREAAVPHFRPAVTNIGFRPTITGARPERPRVEVHLLDHDGDLYGSHLEVVFVAHLRGEERFADVEALAAQIARDCARARALLGGAPPPPARARSEP